MARGTCWRGYEQKGMAQGGEVFEPRGQKPIQVKKQLSRIR